MMRLLCLVLFAATTVHSQFFDPVLDDKTYLDKIEEQIQQEVESSALQLVESTKEAEKVTKSYISTKLKDNVFKALRTLAEAEAVEIYEKTNKFRVGRDGTSDDSSGGSKGESAGDNDADTVESETEQSEKDEETEKPTEATTPLNGLSTAVKINQNVFQFIGEAIKTIFQAGKPAKIVRGDSAEVDTTSNTLVEAIPSLMKKPYADQLIGIVGILGKRSDKTETEKKALKNPIERLFGNRGRKSNSEEGEVVQYIQTLKKNHPLLFPDLYRGIPEAQRLLESMERVVAGINRDEIQA